MRWKYRMTCRRCKKKINREENYVRCYIPSLVDEKLDKEEFEHLYCYEGIIKEEG